MKGSAPTNVRRDMDTIAGSPLNAVAGIQTILSKEDVPSPADDYRLCVKRSLMVKSEAPDQPAKPSFSR
jgi:hypothetical protein